MAEELLDRAEVCASFQEVGGEGVPEPVGSPQEAARRAGVEAPAAGGQEDGVLGAGREVRPPVAQVARQSERSLLAERGVSAPWLDA